MALKRLQYVFVLAIALALSLSSCVTASIVSNKNPEFKTKITKMYVMSRCSPASKAFLLETTKMISNSLKSRGVENIFYYMDELALESEKDITKKIDDYNPDVYMIISETEHRTKVGSFGIQTNTGSTLDLKMFTPDRQSPVWRATLMADGSMGIEEASQKAAQYFIDKLKTDGIIN
jgi:hypothetical protein